MFLNINSQFYRKYGKPTLFYNNQCTMYKTNITCTSKTTLIGGAGRKLVICTLWNLTVPTWDIINKTKTRILTLKPTLYLQRNPHYYGPLKICPKIYKNTLVGRA